MKLEKIENLKLRFVNQIETNTTHINNNQGSDTDLNEKITEILKIYEKNPNFKGKPSFKKRCNYCRRYGDSIAKCRQNQQDNQNKPQKHKEPNKSFYQYMKKDQNLTNRNIYSNNSSGKPLSGTSNYSSNQSPYNSSYRGRSLEQRISRNFSQNRYSQSNSQNNQNRNNYSRSISNTTEFVSASSSIQTQGIDTITIIDHEIHRTTEIETLQTIGIQVIPTIKIRTIKATDQGTTHIIDQILKNQNNNYYNRPRNNSQNRNSSYNNRYRNCSQSPHRNNNRYPDSKHRYRSNTPKHQSDINQVQINEETTSDPPGNDNTENNELQLNHINCESLDAESDTDITISVNMITVKNDYEPIIYEQPFNSDIYENQLELLHNYYTRSIDKNTRTTQEVDEINIVIKPDKNDEVQ